jgi:hypothetical protein
MVDVGSQVYCQAIVDDASRIYLDVGLGFRVECDVMSGEAIRAVRLRKQALQDQVQPELLTCAQQQHPAVLLPSCTCCLHLLLEPDDGMLQHGTCAAAESRWDAATPVRLCTPSGAAVTCTHTTCAHVCYASCLVTGCGPSIRYSSA